MYTGVNIDDSKLIPMERAMRIGLAQMNCKLGKVKANIEKIKDFISQAKKEKVNLLVFPELSITGYCLSQMVPQVALNREDPQLKDLVEKSQDISLVIGFVEEAADYNFYNSAFYAEKGKIRYIHRKVYLPNYGIWEEGRYFAPGEKMRGFSTQYGPVAILICEDSWHPILPYISSLDGALFLIFIAASFEKTLGESFSVRSSWEELNRVWAKLFSCYVIFVNRVGYEGEGKFWGGSCIIGPQGKEVVKAPYYEEKLVVGEVEKKQIRNQRFKLPLLRSEKIDLALRELNRIQKEKGG